MSDVGIRFASYFLSDEMTSDDGFNAEIFKCLVKV